MREEGEGGPGCERSEEEEGAGIVDDWGVWVNIDEPAELQFWLAHVHIN